MPELKRSFQSGRMNKDLDERLVPNGEYTDAMNVEVATSEDSEVGTVQTAMGNVDRSPNIPEGFCVGTIADEKNDKLYWLVSGDGIDFIAEYDYETQTVAAVCVDKYIAGGPRALYFDPTFPITGINILDDILFWTDNNSEPKRINITRGKLGSTDSLSQPIWTTSTEFQVRDVSAGSAPNTYVNAGPIKEEHLTIIKRSPPTAPVLEMKDTSVGDFDMDGVPGEVFTTLTLTGNIFVNPSTGEYWDRPVNIGTNDSVDYRQGDFLIISSQDDPTAKIRVYIDNGWGGSSFDVTVIGGDKNIQFPDGEYDVELEDSDAMFQFKFPRFAYRYKYEDGEYSTFSPFTEVAFLPGEFDYFPKEGYNLGMVNNLRKIIIKDYVHDRLMPDDVISIDLLYKESNSANIYSIKTIKRKLPEHVTDNSGRVPVSREVWDPWNAISSSEISGGGVRGFYRITSEMIHAVLPANQLLRPWDNVPRKALAQEVTKNRLVYGNYLQNYDIFNSETNEKHIDVQVKISIESRDVGDRLPEQRNPGLFEGGYSRAYTYNPAKSIKTLRTYQLGVVYIDKYGRETPVFSSDKRGANTNIQFERESNSSIYLDKQSANKQNKIKAQIMSTPPEWAKAWKFFIKETSNEYYNLAMDRWYNAEDGNIWISFPSAERNKIDEDTFLILKKEHDLDKFVEEPARYKVVAIENEAPPFIKLQNNALGSLVDTTGDMIGVGGGTGFPRPGQFEVYLDEAEFELLGWAPKSGSTGNTTGKLYGADISDAYFRLATESNRSNWYKIKKVGKYDSGNGYYTVTSTEKFGQDMGMTSLDPNGPNFYINRVGGLEFEVVKREEKNKPEFQGRFFVKIAKDYALINRIIKPSEDEVEFIETSAQVAQYIDPNDVWSQSGNWDGYGSDPDKISYDSTQGDFKFSPGSSGDGELFWKMASRGTHDDSNSEGWFIDKVEGFRRFKFTKHFFDNDDSFRTNSNRDGSAKTFMWASGWDWDKLHIPTPNLQLCGLDTYNIDPITKVHGSATSNYLGISHNKSPGSKARSHEGDSGRIISPQGIEEDISVIHLSYSGIGERTVGSGKAPTTAESLYLDLAHADNQGKHAADLQFANEITTPGTLWKWREDPGQVIYKTMKPPTSHSGGTFPYTTKEWQANKEDAADNGVGVGLFNYAVFRDYTIDPHHTHHINYRIGTNTHEHCNMVSQEIGYHSNHAGGWCFTDIALDCHCADASRGFNPMSCDNGPYSHDRFPCMTPRWNKADNKRRKIVFYAKSKDVDHVTGQPWGLGETGPHYYLPTNDPDLPAHFDNDVAAITSPPSGAPNAGVAFDQSSPAPGIRRDGVYSGYELNGSEIPGTKTWNSSPTSAADQSQAPGSCTFVILSPWSEDGAKYSSTNPAIFETEPKEDVGLDIYYEVGQIYPIELNNDTIEQFVGGIHRDLSLNSYVRCYDNSLNGWIILDTCNPSCGTFEGQDIRVSAADGNSIELRDANGVVLDDPLTQVTPDNDQALIFVRPDGSSTESYYTGVRNGVQWRLWPNAHNNPATIPWFNCYSFGNGVESDRVRDDFNQVTIDNGPKASTTLEEPYLEERRGSGLIYSGIYNSKSGVNNLNQFIQAEKITKDLNPTYGSIQKLHTRNTDLLTLCEDKILKVLANKDALYNADGNMNLTATANVLGQTIPIAGEYGISKNPESFASESYRAYFTDKTRGTVLRMSQDGLTPISNVGMKDWFGDNLRNAKRIIGSVDDEKALYNITLLDAAAIPLPTPTPTVSPVIKPILPPRSLIPHQAFPPFTTGVVPVIDPSWNCDDNFNCVDPGDGSGLYLVFNDCQNNCRPITRPSWNCDDGNCVDPGDGSGDHHALGHCLVACGVVFGCTDSTAINYDPLAVADCVGVPGGSNLSCCNYIISPTNTYGCKDPTAANYSSICAADPLCLPCDGTTLQYGNQHCIPGQTLITDPLGCCCKK